MKYNCLFVFMILIIGETSAQTIPSDSVARPKLISYFFNVQSGPLVGCTDCKKVKNYSFSASTIHGLKIGEKLRAGVGLGFDTYRDWRVLPFFGSVSWDLFGKKNKVFTQLNYGWARAWNPYVEMFGYNAVKGGQSFAAMMGYRIAYGDMRIALLAGWKSQITTMSHEQPYYSWLMANTVYESSFRQTTKSNLNRIAISLSVGWK
jgi:hypothetical protein